MANKVSHMHLSSAGAQGRNGARSQRRDAAAARTGSAQWLAGLWQRLVSALFLIPIVIALVVCGGWFAFSGAVIALVLGTFELRNMFAHKHWHPPLLLSLGIGLDFLVAAMVLSMGHNLMLFLLILSLGISILIVTSFGWLILTRKTLESALLDWALTIASAFYLGWPLAFFLVLRGPDFGASNPGFWWLLALFFMVWANDTFALLTGHYFGHTKLAPNISPAKTWEGFGGGLVFTVIAAFVFTMLLPGAFGYTLHVTWYIALALGVLVTIAATIGDLAESLLKRGTGVKDSGTIVPGHGGLLDRMDSLLFAVLVVFFFAVFLHGVVI